MGGGVWLTWADLIMSWNISLIQVIRSSNLTGIPRNMEVRIEELPAYEDFCTIILFHFFWNVQKKRAMRDPTE